MSTHFSCAMLAVTYALILATSECSRAGLGESLEELKTRYGQIENVQKNIGRDTLPTYFFETSAFRVCATFLDSRCVRIEYQANDKTPFPPERLKQLLKENAFTGAPFVPHSYNTWESHSGPRWRRAYYDQEGYLSFIAHEFRNIRKSQSQKP